MLGFGFGVLIFKELTLIEIAIIATILAPTDAALGKAVVTNESVPNKLREGLSFESGLNDGICVPILFIFLALVSHAGIEDDTASHAIHLVLEEVGIGAITGIILALIATWLLKRLSRYGWDSETWEQLKLIALAIGSDQSS